MGKEIKRTLRHAKKEIEYAAAREAVLESGEINHLESGEINQ